MNEEERNEVEIKQEKLDDKNYLRLIAAQNEATRRLKIKSVNNVILEELEQKNKYAFISGAFFAGVVAATYFSGININQAIQMEIQSLNSFDALKDYLSSFTPAMWATLAGTAVSFSRYLEHKKGYQKALQQLNDLAECRPEKYMNLVDREAKSK